MELGQPRRKRRPWLRFVFVLLVLSGIAGAIVVTFRTSDPPEVTLEPGLPAIGPRTPLRVVVSEPKRGVAEVVVELIQGGQATVLAREAGAVVPAHAIFDAPPGPLNLDLVVGKETVPGLVPGEATVRVTAKGAATWAFAPEPTVVEKTLPVRLVPPTVSVSSPHIYPTQGGAEVVVYEVGESAVKSGVRVGEWWFSGFPLPKGSPSSRFAIFAIPYDRSDASDVKLVASDDVGNEMAVNFIDRFNPKPFKTDTITVTDSFMEKVVPRIMQKTPTFKERGSLLDNYLAINKDMRKENADRLIELAKESRPELMWTQPFVQMQAQVFSSFADRRTYVYDGRPVDRQDHLGFDLASTKRAQIPCANRGVVVLAEYFGIYGNAVVIDHGYGLMSLYGHLSSFDVEAGQTVERGQIIGRTGATGLALGDHLHFTMLLAGLPVTPLEWWDAHWLHDRIVLKLADAFPFEIERP